MNYNTNGLILLCQQELKSSAQGEKMSQRMDVFGEINSIPNIS